MPDPAPPLIGKTISGYEILELVGEGGMGAVYRARQLSLDREVAFKVLAARLAGNDEFVARFRREARSIAKVNHPNILQVHDVADADGMHFIVMEFIKGTSLSEKLKDKGFIDWKQCADYIRQAAMGLASAAKAGIIHRDVKPDNIMITDNEVVKVSDFGLAKEISSAELTQTGDLMGTPAYMSPEQCDGGRLDTRTDIYSLGASFYRAVTGVLPFNAPTPVAMMYKQKHEPLIPPKQYMPNLPEAISQVIMRMMAKEPDSRFPQMEEVAVAIADAIEGREPPLLDSTLKIHTGPPATGMPGSPPADVFPAFGQGADFILPGTEPGESFADMVARGDQMAADGHIVAACECWKQALEINPGDAGVKERLTKAKKESSAACLQIGAGLLEQGKLSAQRANLERIIKVDPDNVDAREKLAALDFMEQQKRAAILNIRKYLSGGDQEKALELWESLHPAMRDRALMPTMDNLKNKVIPCQRLAAEAKKLTEAGDFAEAFAKWDEALKLDPTNDRVKLGRQETHRRYEHMESALRDGYEFNVKRQYQAAITSFEQVLDICPEHTQAKRYITEAMTELARSSEERHDFQAAIDLWQKVLQRDPGNKSVMERLENATRQRNALKQNIDEAKKALQKGRYTRSTAMFRKALAIQPENKTAIFGLEEAKSRRFKRRMLPVFAIIVLLATGGGITLHLQYKQQMDEGDTAFRNARSASPEMIKSYSIAIRNWSTARLIPIFGNLHQREIANKIARATVHAELDKKDVLYNNEDLEKLLACRDKITAMLEDNLDLLGEDTVNKAKFKLEWQIAHTLAKAARYQEAQKAYQRATKIAEKSESARFPVKQDNIRRAIDNYLLARTLRNRKDGSRQENEKQARQLLLEVKQQWPELTEAMVLLRNLEGMRLRIADMVKRASKLIAAARAAQDSGRHDDAREKFTQAGNTAREILKLQPTHWLARKIESEAKWRKQAGPGMVFFVFPYSDDLQMERKFRAFAIDRYEWPNRKGADPVTPTFVQALKLAGDANKDLPRREEWRYAAQGGEQERIYSYGNAYSMAKGNTGKKRIQPWPCGSHPDACTPEGIFDMTGNLAEWVIVIGRNRKADKQYVVGGSYNSAPRECRNDSFQLRDARIQHKDVGFRAVLRWQIQREH